MPCTSGGREIQASGLGLGLTLNFKLRVGGVGFASLGFKASGLGFRALGLGLRI